MKKFVLGLFVLLFVAFSIDAVAQGNDKDFLLKFEPNSFKELGTDGTIFLPTLYDWPRDPNGKESAMIRIKIKNMTVEDAESLHTKVSSGTSHLVKQEFNKKYLELVVFLTPSTNTAIEVYGGIDLKSRPYSIDRELKSKHAYEITLVCEKRTVITILPKPRDIVAFVDGMKTDNNKIKVLNGKHEVTFSRNGRTIGKKEIIYVSEENNTFLFDLREKREVKVISEPSKADIYVMIDGKKEYFGQAPTTISLPEGTYTIIANYKDLSKEELITIPTGRDVVINIEYKNWVEFYAVIKGRRVAANLNIKRIDGGEYKPDNSEIKDRKMNFRLLLPHGRYEVIMSNDDNSSKKNISVSNNDNQIYRFNLTKNRFLWPWNINFYSHVAGIYVGYVQRSLCYYTDNDAVDFVSVAWRELNKSTSGVRAGIHFQPCFSWGLGLYTGAFFEYYYSKASDDSYGYTSYSEKAVTVPLHLYMRLPISRNAAFALHGGINAEYLWGATYKDSNNVYMTWTPSYGKDFMPKHFNCGYGVGVSFQVYSVMIEATWNYGITNNKHIATDSEEYGITYSTVTYKSFNIGLSILI